MQHRPEAQVAEVVIYLADRHAIDPAQGAQMHNVVALLNTQRIGYMAGGRTATPCAAPSISWLSADGYSAVRASACWC